MYALLISEDADDIAIFSMILQRAGLAVTTAKNLQRAIQNWSQRPADIILISLSEPPPQQQVQLVRDETLVPLVLAVNGLDDSIHCVLLKMGADLVVPSSFNAKLLIAQIGVLLRRSGTTPTFSLPTLNVAGLTLDPATRTVVVAQNPSQRLTHLEFRLLYTLMTHRGQIIPTEMLVERVWGYTGQGDRDLVRGLVSRLRGKVEVDARNPQYIVTVPGIGYSFKEDE
jgi:DNA-binding response OmpR family regulator